MKSKPTAWGILHSVANVLVSEIEMQTLSCHVILNQIADISESMCKASSLIDVDSDRAWCNLL